MNWLTRLKWTLVGLACFMVMAFIPILERIHRRLMRRRRGLRHG